MSSRKPSQRPKSRTHRHEQIEAVELPPLAPFQQGLIALLPLAEALVDRVVTTLCFDAVPFTVEDAMTFLYQRMMQTTHTPTRSDSEDEDAGNRMSAAEDAALMVGYVLGRRIGGAR